MSDSTPSRRRMLSAGLAAVVGATAGCLDGRPSSDADVGGGGGTDRVLTLTLDDAGETLRDRAVVDPAETDPRWDESAFEAVRDGKSHTTQYRKPFFSTDDDPTYAVHEGTYYRLGSVIVDEVETTRPVLRLFDADGTEAVDAETLSEGDRHAVEIAHLAARARGDVGGMPVGVVERGGYVYRDEGAIEASALLAEEGPTRVAFRDTVYRIETGRERFYEPVYRAIGEPVAESPERMEAILRARDVGARLTEADLSADAREVIETARYDGYDESHPFSDAYEEVLRTIHERPYLDGNIEKDAIGHESESRTIRYEGRYYDYRLRFEPAGGDA